MSRALILAFTGTVGVAAVFTGVEVALTVHEVRALHAELEQTRRAQNQLMAEHSRLLLERSALAAYQNVEQLAETELAMQFPDHVELLSQ
ncbi:MAG: cell division protein FtsL [Pseudomonadales bacterium]|nr:cell division protein FtsL [Pseudomonadales bacterium]MDP6470875.1 cell division protein FtsL [Pseudomonadales bacterium]MDP6825940.1 cell division protein FtsL [Pseudomonadales bacterium]MDP6972252.1 cell division protein FtsL [Pseudomonadales bacterium]